MRPSKTGRVPAKYLDISSSIKWSVSHLLQLSLSRFMVHYISEARRSPRWLGDSALGSGHLCVRLRLAGPSRAQTWQKPRPPDTPIAEPASHANHSQGHQTTVDHTRTN